MHILLHKDCIIARENIIGAPSLPINFGAIKLSIYLYNPCKVIALKSPFKIYKNFIGAIVGKSILI